MKKYVMILASVLILFFSSSFNASAATATQKAIYTIDELAKTYGKNGLNYISMVEYMNDGNGFKQLSLTTNFDFLDNVNNSKYNALLAASFKIDIKQLRFYNDKSKYIAFIKSENYKKFLNGTMSNSAFANSIELIPNSKEQTSYSNNSAMKNSAPSLYSYDLKVYLGKLTTNKYDKDSIYNEYGTYGSKYQTKSIWNEYGVYGSNFSQESAFNNLASKPPAIVYDGAIIGHLTSNTTIPDGVNIAALSNWLTDNGF
ncbi:hypothetical protein MHH28_07945 [Paenibacillus sp. FSL K6-1217]|uniref:hypothetical protein n=1 Tax=Paenibacillus sp. FSL K6-1217 TaxID=2921466 RepID=UPI003243836F